MTGYYLRRSEGFVGFNRDRSALWPVFNIGWAVLEIWPSWVADRLNRILRDGWRK